jgi:hypothetical protein
LIIELITIGEWKKKHNDFIELKERKEKSEKFILWGNGSFICVFSRLRFLFG